MESNPGHAHVTYILSKLKQIPTSLACFISPSVRSLISADYCANRLTPKHHSFRSRDSPH